MSVLCGVDFSENSRKALARAVRLARAGDDHLVLVHSVAHSDEEAIWRHFVETPWEVPEKTRRAARARLRSFFKESIDTEQQPDTVDFVVKLRSASKGILETEEGADTPFDWIVLGATGSGRIANVLLGSTAEKVVRNCLAPVLVVPPTAPDLPDWQTILAPVDYSSDSHRALETAITLAEGFDAHLHILHAFTLPVQGLGLLDMQATPESMEAYEKQRWNEFEKYLSNFDFAEIDYTEHLRLGGPYSAIRNVIDDLDGGVDLICMGTRGKSGIQRMVLGSVTAKVLRTMPAEVMAFHAIAE
jgi:nucleotide-binding universal stress UspA family protein